MRPFRRGNPFVGIPIPVPGTLGNPEVIDDAHFAKGTAGNASVVECAPDGLSATPWKTVLCIILSQVSPSRIIFSRTIGCSTAIFRNYCWHARLLKLRNVAAVTVISGYVAQLIDSFLSQRTLRTTDSCRAGRIELFGKFDGFFQ